MAGERIFPRILPGMVTMLAARLSCTSCRRWTSHALSRFVEQPRDSQSSSAGSRMPCLRSDTCRITRYIQPRLEFRGYSTSLAAWGMHARPNRSRSYFATCDHHFRPISGRTDVRQISAAHGAGKSMFGATSATGQTLPQTQSPGPHFVCAHGGRWLAVPRYFLDDVVYHLLAWHISESCELVACASV
jgi:hypothetical protein